MRVYPILMVVALCSTVFGAPYSYKSGPFTVLYDPDNLPTLQVVQAGRLVPVVWRTSNSSKALVSAFAVEEDVEQNGGSFVFSSKTLEQCTDMKITENGTRPAQEEVNQCWNDHKMFPFKTLEQCSEVKIETESMMMEQSYPEIYFIGELCGSTQFQLLFQAVNVPDSVETVTHLMFNLTMSNASKYNQLHFTYGCEEDEQFYGFGAQYSKFNMKGQRLPLFLSEQGVGRGLQPITWLLDLFSPGAGGTWYTTYTRVPHYITSYQRSLLLESLEYAVFDMTSSDSVTIELNSNVMTGRIIPGSSPLELITSYTAYIGRMQPLPEWVGKGAVLGLQGGTDAVLQTINQVEQVWGNLSDVTAVWLQDWTGQRNFSGTKDLPRTGLWWNWEVDSTHYPKWTDLIANLRSKGIKTLTYINCMLSDISQRGTPYNHNYFKEGAEKGYLVKNPDGSIWTGYSNSTMVDLSNPEAYKWMVDIIVQNMLATGVCGWMCDFGESVPLEASLKSREDAHKFHSRYPSVWARLNADAIGNATRILQSRADASSSKVSTCDPNDVVYFMRSGNVHSPDATRLFWLGDQMVTWDSHDGLATVIIGMLSEGISGYSLTHSDIGGYTAIHKYIVIKYVRTKELFLRWCELAAFTMMYRSHLGTLPNEDWQFNSDTETTLHFFNMTLVFQAWGFYRSALMEEAHRLGWPVARHMMLVFPNNSKVHTEDLRFQFMLGTQLLVAPVYIEGHTSVEVFLPLNTTWVHTWTGTHYTGDDEKVEIAVPMGRPCVLYPTGSQVGERFVRNLRERKVL